MKHFIIYYLIRELTVRLGYDDDFPTKEEHLRHSINSHKGKPAQPDDKCLFELLGIQPKGNSWEKL